jgi:hypothetical protein
LVKLALPWGLFVPCVGAKVQYWIGIGIELVNGRLGLHVMLIELEAVKFVSVRIYRRPLHDILVLIIDLGCPVDILL